MIVNTAARNRYLEHLHPVFRGAVQHVLADLDAARIPFALFEGWRHPVRQQFLYVQHPPVTHARPWQSCHQYGVAADFVLYLQGSWSWRTDGYYGAFWTHLHEIGAKYNLEPLGFEQPHLQLAGLNWQSLNEGKYPDGGDDMWAENLEAAIIDWHGKPLCPVPPQHTAVRPPLPEGAPNPFDPEAAGSAEGATTPETSEPGSQ